MPHVPVSRGEPGIGEYLQCIGIHQYPVYRYSPIPSVNTYSVLYDRGLVKGLWSLVS